MFASHTWSLIWCALYLLAKAAMWIGVVSLVFAAGGYISPAYLQIGADLTVFGWISHALTRRAFVASLPALRAFFAAHPNNPSAVRLVRRIDLTLESLNG